MNTASTTLFVLHIDALSSEMLAHLSTMWMVSIVAQGSTEKHGLHFTRFWCSGEVAEGFLAYLDGQMNVLDYAIEGRQT